MSGFVSMVAGGILSFVFSLGDSLALSRSRFPGRDEKEENAHALSVTTHTHYRNPTRRFWSWYVVPRTLQALALSHQFSPSLPACSGSQLCDGGCPRTRSFVGESSRPVVALRFSFFVCFPGVLQLFVPPPRLF